MTTPAADFATVPSNQSAPFDENAPFDESDRLALRDLLVAWYLDPVAFARDALGVDLWHAQRRIAHAVRRHPRVAVRSCHAAGKTFLAAVIVLWFLATRPNAIVLTTASTFRQVRYVLWRTIRRLVANAPRGLGATLLDTELRFDDAWYALGLSTDDPERFQGFHAPHLLVVVDEPGAIPEPVFAAIEGVLASGHTRLLMIGNPTQPQGPFYDAFHAQASAYRTFKISAFDTPNLAAPAPVESSPKSDTSAARAKDPALPHAPGSADAKKTEPDRTASAARSKDPARLDSPASADVKNPVRPDLSFPPRKTCPSLLGRSLPQVLLRPQGAEGSKGERGHRHRPAR